MKPHVIFIALILLIGVADASVVAPTSWGKGWKLFNVNGTYWDLMGEPGVQNGSLKNVSCQSNCTGFSAQVSREQIPGQTGVDDWQNQTMNNSCDSSYCIRLNGSTVEAVNGTSGAVEFSGADAATVHNQAYATAGTLPKKTFMSTGNFSLSTYLDPHSNSILIWQPAKFILADGANTDIIKNTTSNDGIEIIGGYLDVNGANQISNGRGIQLQNTSNLTIRGTQVANARLQSFYIAQLGSINDVLLDNVKAYNGAVDIASNNEIFVSGSNIKIKDCISKGSYDGGVVASSYSLYPGSLNNGITIEGCDIQDAGTGIYIGNNGQNVYILHNTINRTRDTTAADGAGIQIQKSSLGTNASSRIIVDGNILDNIVYRGFHIYNNASYLKLTNNFVTVTDNGSQDINTFIQDVSNVDMYGNTLNQSGGHVISLSNVQNSKIYSNTILSPNRAGAGGSGIRGVNVSNVSMYNNDIFDRATPMVMQYPIYITGSESSNNYAYDNNIQIGTSAGITGVTTKWQNLNEAGYDHGISTTCTSKTAFGAGDTCTNSTTGYGYTYNGTSWVVNTPRVSIPSSATSPCQTGEQAYNSTYFYACIADNIWVRTNMTSW